MYSPAQIEGDLAHHKMSAFRCGFDEEIDDEGEIEAAASLASSADLAIVMTAVGKDWESEGYDRPHLRLPRLQSNLVERVAKAQRETILVNVSGSAVELPFADRLKALVQTWYGGQEAGAAVVDILLGQGRAPASGRLCTTWPISVRDQPDGSGPELFPGKDLTGRGHPDVKYAEGRLVGYKWYEAKGIRPAHYFGSGLGGYTTFDRKLLQVKGADVQQGSDVEVAVEVTNTGARSGKDIVQMYIAPPSNLIKGDVPHKEVSGGTRGDNALRYNTLITSSLRRVHAHSSQPSPPCTSPLARNPPCTSLWESEPSATGGKAGSRAVAAATGRWLRASTMSSWLPLPIQRTKLPGRRSWSRKHGRGPG